MQAVAEMRDVADGLWLWRRRYPGWHEDAGWPPETPAYLPEQHALVFSDGVMCDPNDGLLRVWFTPWHERRVVPALRAILETHDVEHVLVSHGEPVHTRDELIAALDRECWT